MRALLIGNYGTGNFGDEALKEYFLRAFPDIAWQVVSAHPKADQLPRLPAGVRSFLGLQWIKTLRALRQADAVVFGGGTLFTDAESPHACFIWYVHARIARWMGKPVLLAFQGIGPFRTARSIRRARWVVAHAAFLSVRDAASAKRVVAWGKSIKIVQTFDPVYALLHHQKEDGSQNVLVIIPRRNSTDLFLKRIREMTQADQQRPLRILSLEPDDFMERAVCDSLKMGFPGIEVKAVRTVDDMICGLRGASFVLTQRYHGAIAALACGIPFETVAQGAGDKLGEVMHLQKTDRPTLLGLVEEGERALRNTFAAGVSGEKSLRSSLQE